MSYLPIPGFETSYEINKQGTVRSLARDVLGKDGTIYPFRARIKKHYINTKTGYLSTSLWKNNTSTVEYIHRLVAKVFLPNPENKPEVNHKDGDVSNPHVDNLEWVTSEENSIHAVETGLIVYSNRLSEDQFLECLYRIIDERVSYKYLTEFVPYKVPFLSTKIRSIAKKYNIEHLLDESLMEQKITRARINGAKNH